MDLYHDDLNVEFNEPLLNNTSIVEVLRLRDLCIIKKSYRKLFTDNMGLPSELYVEILYLNKLINVLTENVRDRVKQNFTGADLNLVTINKILSDDIVNVLFDQPYDLSYLQDAENLNFITYYEVEELAKIIFPSYINSFMNSYTGSL